jgi:hypothetical protein
MLSQIPPISKIVVSLDEFDTVALLETKLVGTAGNKFIWARQVSR